jgi:adenosyl cobinamide kinase/adenosyl cobinamide phosphate guanylyltransferase
MGKLFNLKKWLTVADAARHLSIVFGEEVTEADVLRLALDGHLTLSVNFVNETVATRGAVVPNSKAKVVPGIRVGGEEPYFVMLGYRLNRDEIIQFDDHHTYIRDVWDLCMLESEKFDVEEWFYREIGGPSVDRWSMEGAMVTKGDGDIYRLEEEMEKPTKESFDKQSGLILNGLMNYIARDSIGDDEAKRLIDEHHERRKSIWEDKSLNYCPASALPADSLLVVRTDALREFEQSVNGAPKGENKPLATPERNTLLTIIAALCDYSAIKVEERGAANQIAKLTEEIGATVSDDTVRRWLKAIPDALETRMK